jgi:hypothetical protein
MPRRRHTSLLIPENEMKLVISLATRGRPELLCDTIRKSVANWTNKNTVMQVQLDHDDPAPYDYLIKQKIHERVIPNVQQREDTIAAKWNRALLLPADVYTVAADDDPYVTPGYDDKILEASKRFPDGIGMVYADLANLSFTGSLSMTSKMANMLGYIQPEYFPYWFCDHWTDDIARMIGRFTHGGFRTDQSRAGQTKEMREPDFWSTFFDACYIKRRREAKAIIDSPKFKGEKWQKDLIFSQHPLIEQRSRTLNSIVRQQSKQLAQASPVGMDLKNERYMRLKKRALDMLPELFADPEMPTQEVVAFQNVLTPPTSIGSFPRAYA